MNLRKDARGKTLARWWAQGPAIIERPRKLVHAVTNEVTLPDGTKVRILSTQARAADLAAARGDGAEVKAIARQVLA